MGVHVVRGMPITPAQVAAAAHVLGFDPEHVKAFEVNQKGAECAIARTQDGSVYSSHEVVEDNPWDQTRGVVIRLDLLAEDRRQTLLALLGAWGHEGARFWPASSTDEAPF